MKVKLPREVEVPDDVPIAHFVAKVNQLLNTELDRVEGSTLTFRPSTGSNVRTFPRVVRQDDDCKKCGGTGEYTIGEPGDHHAARVVCDHRPTFDGPPKGAA